MDRLNLLAEERKILGKKVKKLREIGKLPAHIFGKGMETEVVSVDGKIFLKTFKAAGETGLIDLKIGKEKVRPVLVRGVQHDPVSGYPIHIDFFAVDLTQKVKVQIPLVLIGEQPDSVHLGETIVLQTLNQLEVEALPADLVEKIEVDITPLQNINDAITVSQLSFDRTKLTIHAAEDEIVVKLAPAITEEMKKQMEEEAAEAAAKAAEAPPVGGEGAVPAEGTEGAAPAEGEPASADSASVATPAKGAATAGKAAEAGPAAEQPKKE